MVDFNACCGTTLPGEHGWTANARDHIRIAVARPKLPRPTDGELEILRVLWRKGPSAVRDVHEELNRRKKGSINAVATVLQIMLGKGYVRRDESRRPAIYHSILTEDHAKRHLLRDLIARVFNGSTSNLILHSLDAQKASDEELEEVRRHLAKRRRK